MTLPAPPGLKFVATATDASGNTSEFSAPGPGQLTNISTRLRVLTGDNVLIGGMFIGGTDAKKVVLRAIGPSLANPPFNLTGVLADPTIEVHDGTGAIIGTNNNWKDSQQAEIAATGLGPTNDLESAILLTLPASGSYTAIVRGNGGGTGVVTSGASASRAPASTAGWEFTTSIRSHSRRRYSAPRPCSCSALARSRSAARTTIEPNSRTAS